MIYTKGSPAPERDGDRLQVTVDVVIFTLFDDDLRILLLRREAADTGRWALPGGVLQPDEGLESAALRILAAEAGLGDIYLEQLYTFGDPSRHPGGRVITVAYLAVVPADQAVALNCGSDLGWYSVYALPPLAHDYGRIVDYALTRLRYKLEYTAVGFELLPQAFTLTELQSAYEIVLGEDLDKRNFRRKILGADVIEPSGSYRSGEGRPARLYRYRQDAVAEVKARRLFP
jgi:8-oxo-dGTP diphosphatase